MKRQRWLVFASLLTAFALIVAACGDDDDAATTQATTATTQAATTTAAPATTTTAAAATTTTAAPATTTTAGAPGISFDTGVTTESCPGSSNPDNGCIYLGVISDLSIGPFAGVAIPLTQAQEDFWAAVNAAGGLDGFDVAITADNTVDAHYQVDETVAGYEQIRGDVVALAQTLGTPQTQAALDAYDDDSTVAVPATWWSGWSFDDVDQGLILEAGSSYCFEAMNSMEFAAGAYAGEGKTFPTTADIPWAIIKFPGDYGGDWAAGAKLAAAQLGYGDPVAEILQVPFAAGGSANEAVATLATLKPFLIVIISGPTEMATIAGGLFTAGHQQFQMIGAGPTWNVALLANAEVLPLLQAVYFLAAPWAGWDFDSAGHAAMRAAAVANERTPNTGYTAGWVFQYNMKALLEQGIANGDLTRAGLRAGAGTLADVDYGGMLPNRSFVGSPADHAERGTIVGRVDPTASDGIAPVTPFFTGQVAAAHDFTAPCFAP